jgi:ATP-dependent RNA helicase RhlE
VTSFSDLGLSAPILAALAEEKYETPTPIQGQAIPHVAAGRDLLGIAQTGTGKTAAFALPIIHRLSADPRPAARRTCRVLILSPTRELASQIAESFKAYGRHLKLSVAVVFGGVSPHAQVQTLARGVDVLVATPGRLMDHAGSRAVSLDKTEIFVLDEADQMLDLGFIHTIRKLVKMLPAERQNLFFSATMPGEIGKLAAELLRDPVRVAVTPVATTVDKIEQRVLFVDTPHKRALLAELLGDKSMARTLVFTRTKHGADRVVRHLDGAGIRSAAIHGNKSQSQRERALGAFREGRTPVLVATDIAARGIDVDGVTHVVNFDLPNIPESYVHRIGRTARAGASGIAISFCDQEERAYLRSIEKLIRKQIPATDRRNGNAPAPTPRVARDDAPSRDGDHREGRQHNGYRDGNREGYRGGRHNGRQGGDHRDGRRGEAHAGERQRHDGQSEHRDDRRQDRHPPRDRSSEHRTNGSGHHGGRHASAPAHTSHGGTERRDAGGAPALFRPARPNGGKPKRFRGGAPRRMGV